MLKSDDLRTDDLRSMNFQGEIVDVDDPTKSGMCRVRVFGKYDELEKEDIPWARPQGGLSFGQKGGTGSLSVPRVGAVVSVTFDNGNPYTPIYFNVQEMSPDVLSEISNSYENAHSLIYDGDENLKIFYTREKGLMISLKDSVVNIASDNSITIEHKDTSSIIELRGGVITVTADSEINLTGGSRVKLTAPEVWLDGKATKTGHVPAYRQVLGEPLFAALKVLAAAVDAKMYSTPGVMMNVITQAEELSLSTTCTVSK